MSEVETLGLSDGTGTGVGTWHFAFGVETHSAMQSVAVAFSQTYSVQKLQTRKEWGRQRKRNEYLCGE